MIFKHYAPADIEQTSMAIIRRELETRECTFPEEVMPVVMRVIHTTADFDYLKNLIFLHDAVHRGVEALRRGAVIVTDTKMASAGINRRALDKMGLECQCLISHSETIEKAKRQGITRAAVAMQIALEQYEDPILIVGNAPTALIRIADMIEAGYRPALVVGVPVGFVNVVESKENAARVCGQAGVPLICNMGRKGGSNVAAAICNALLYIATQQVDPTRRNW